MYGYYDLYSYYPSLELDYLYEAFPPYTPILTREYLDEAARLRDFMSLYQT